MPRFIIERDLPGIGASTHAQLQAIAQKSCGVLADLGTSIQWVHSYVTDDKIYCIYNAPNEEAVRRHAELGGFPANKVSRIHEIIDPITAEASLAEAENTVVV